MKILFICNQGKNRGRTAAELFLSKKILCLNIPDVYSFQQPELKHVLKEKMTKLGIA